MSIFNVLSMIGGLALFLYGMHLMGEGLSKASGGKLESILEKLTSNPVKAVLLGAGVTAIIQSSSATTVRKRRNVTNPTALSIPALCGCHRRSALLWVRISVQLQPRGF